MERPFSSARCGRSSIPPTAPRGLDYFAARWRASGVAALHVAAWHFWEADPSRTLTRKADRRLSPRGNPGVRLAGAAARQREIWATHPEWREKTAILQDAQLDWRKLMNLTNRDCFRATADGTRRW